MTWVLSGVAMAISAGSVWLLRRALTEEYADGPTWGAVRVGYWIPLGGGWRLKFGRAFRCCLRHRGVPILVLRCGDKYWASPPRLSWAERQKVFTEN